MEFPFEKSAMRGEPMSEDLTLSDQLAFQILKFLYKNLRSGVTSREMGVTEKGILLHHYRVYKSQEDRLNSDIKWYSDIQKSIEFYQNKYRKERTLEAADQLSAALDGRLRVIEQ